MGQARRERMPKRRENEWQGQFHFLSLPMLPELLAEPLSQPQQTEYDYKVLLPQHTSLPRQMCQLNRA